jgi:uncharacterized protein YlxW (UPF0749 family)
VTDHEATDRPGVRRIEQLPRSDWTDQDLLTKQEARERLADEIKRTQTRLDQVLATTHPDDAEVTLLERRLNAMRSIRGEYDGYLDGK